MIVRLMLPFAQTQANFEKVEIGSEKAAANRDGRNAPWDMEDHANMQKIATDAQTMAVDFSSAIDKLKTQYEFYEGQDEDILAVLSRYPFLLVDLNRIHEIKCQYFDEAPMSLYYVNETGRLEDADLSASVVFDDDLWDRKFKSSFNKFQEECWREMSQEGHGFISVGFE